VADAARDHLRRTLMLERAGTPTCTARSSPSRVARLACGVLFMHNEGYSTMCGHGVVAVTTIALERGLLLPGGDGATVVYDSPAERLEPGHSQQRRGDAERLWRASAMAASSNGAGVGPGP